MKGEKKFKRKICEPKSDSNMDNEQNYEDKEQEAINESYPEDSSEESDDSSGNETDSEESDESDDNPKEKGDFDHQWEELRKDAPDTDQMTRRLAVCNMDWDRIKAVDLLVCFNSFKPAEGHINSVKIYPSEFGLKRMEEEKLKGPPELVEETLPLDENEREDKKGSKYHREKLRQYQISRLKYYYAVVDCDSPETANTLYEQLNGMEYESSSVRFDLRFIPDDMSFDHKPKCVAEKLPDFIDYKPRLFVTSALQQVKVNLTWDETDPKRREFFQKAFTDPDSVQDDVKEFIASASSEDEIDEAGSDLNKDLRTGERISKFRQLLSELEEKEKKEEEEKNKYDIEVTWEPGLEKKVKEKVKEKMKNDSLNPFEEMLLKKKQEKKMKKRRDKETQKQEEDSSDSEDDANTDSDEKKKLAELALISNLKTDLTVKENAKKKNTKSVELEGFKADMNDPRFSAMYTSSLFNMIPPDQQTKKDVSLKRSKDKKFQSKSHKGRKQFKKARYN